MSLEFDCFAWAGTTDLAVFRDDVVIERTEPGEKGPFSVTETRQICPATEAVLNMRLQDVTTCNHQQGYVQ